MQAKYHRYTSEYLADVCVTNLQPIITVFIYFYFQSELNSWLSTHADTIFPIDCSWAIELKAEFNSSACLNSNSVQARLDAKVCQFGTDRLVAVHDA